MCNCRCNSRRNCGCNSMSNSISNCDCNRNNNSNCRCNRISNNTNCCCNRMNNSDIYADICENNTTNVFPENYLYGHAYTPVQTMNKTFVPEVGLENGSLFPELVSPYSPGQSMDFINYLRNGGNM